MDSRGTCLVIEDDPDIRNLLCLILFDEGFQVHAEATGMEGIRAAKRLDPTLITLDLGLPDLSGQDVARQLREFTQAPMAMITAYSAPEDELDGMASGATAFLIKPFRPARLRELIRELCPQPPGTVQGPEDSTGTD